jgi:hypothetical protein
MEGFDAGMLLKTLVAALVAGVALVARTLLNRPKRVAHALIVTGVDHTTASDDYAVRSVQEADLILPTQELERIWNPMHLERLARTYWRWLSRATLGFVQVDYQPNGRQVKAFGLIPLLTFQEPEYEMDGERGIVRWRIDRGILVAGQGRGGHGYLEIELHRRASRDYDGSSIVHVEVEVANFYPAIAHSISRWLYENTQSRIHVIVTHGFLRNLARLDLAESKVGRFSTIDELPEPIRARDRDGRVNAGPPAEPAGADPASRSAASR